MNLPVLFVFFLATNSLLCEAGFLSSKLDPVMLLSHKLSHLTESENLAANVELALEHNWDKEPEAAQASFIEALEAFKKLHPEDPCHPENVISALTLKKLSGPNNIGFIVPDENAPRVFRLLDSFKDTVEFECFRRIENKWNEDPDRTKRFDTKFSELINLSSLIYDYAQSDRFLSRSGSDVKLLGGAIKLMKNLTSKKNRLKGESVKRVLSGIHKLKSKQQLESISEAEAAQLIEKYLVEPCKELRKQPEVETFFYRIANWGLLVRLSEMVKMGNDVKLTLGPEFNSMKWSARWVFCNVLVKNVNRKRLAKGVAGAGSGILITP